jgi:hypothetical protein
MEPANESGMGLASPSDTAIHNENIHPDPQLTLGTFPHDSEIISSGR